MPGLRFLSIPEMQQNTFSKAQQRSYRSSGKGAVAKDLRNFSKRGRDYTEPSTPENAPLQKSARIATALPGSLIHLSQSADGKLRWLPPSSSASSSLNEGRAFSGCFSGDHGPVSITSPVLIRSENAKSFTASRKLPSKEIEKQESSEAGPASPSLTSCCRDRVASDSSIIHSSEMVDDSDVQEVSFRSGHQVPSTSELSISSQQQAVTAGGKKMFAGVRDLLPSRTCGLSPYLSSKLKPGKHILGVKKLQNYIRPGQLRYWAVGNSPSLASSLANLPATSLKGKACRTLSFC
eukprot:c32791_g1_i1 orf=177-1055(-)